MNILAIDPGPKESAFVEWDGARLGHCAIMPNGSVRDFLEGRLDTSGRYRDVVAIEMVACYGMAVGKEVFETCVWIGRLSEASSIEPKLVYRRDVKLHHCQSARAKDANVRQALIDKYGKPGTKKKPGATFGLKSHLWSAFAVASYISETWTGGVRPQVTK